MTNRPLLPPTSATGQREAVVAIAERDRARVAATSGVQYHVVAIIAPVLASSMVEVSSKGQDDRRRDR